MGSRTSPTKAQREWLARGLDQPGGKLPLFDRQGKRVAKRTIKAAVDAGWAEPWYDNPLKPDWLVRRLTEDGRRIIGRHKAETVDFLQARQSIA